MNKEIWYWINIPYACGGVELDAENFVIKTPPIFRWMRGRRFAEIRKWVDQKGGTVEPL